MWIRKELFSPAHEEGMLITVTRPQEDLGVVYPGTAEAFEMGCICPAVQPHGKLVFRDGCEIHVLEKVKN
jgi:hypothetical protein